MTTTIQINSTQVDNALAQLLQRTQHLQPAFNDIGEAIKNNVLFGFRDEKSPDGINWAALSPQTIKRRRNNSDKILNDTGRLKGSIAHVATNSHVEVTTDVEYAAMMNFGGTKAQFPHLWGDIPARPFFPSSTLPQEWERDVMDVLNLYLQP
jgi:phage virion morphogenesis protein